MKLFPRCSYQSAALPSLRIMLSDDAPAAANAKLVVNELGILHKYKIRDNILLGGKNDGVVVSSEGALSYTQNINVSWGGCTLYVREIYYHASIRKPLL